MRIHSIIVQRVDQKTQPQKNEQISTLQDFRYYDVHRYSVQTSLLNYLCGGSEVTVPPPRTAD